MLNNSNDFTKTCVFLSLLFLLFKYRPFLQVIELLRIVELCDSIIILYNYLIKNINTY